MDGFKRSTVKVKTSDLKGAQMDWVVAQAVGLPVEIHPECCGFGVQSGYGNPPECCADPVYYVYWKDGKRYQPSIDEGDLKACRIIVIAAFGDEVEIPEELLR